MSCDAIGSDERVNPAKIVRNENGEWVGLGHVQVLDGDRWRVAAVVRALLIGESFEVQFPDGDCRGLFVGDVGKTWKPTDPVVELGAGRDAEHVG